MKQTTFRKLTSVVLCVMMIFTMTAQTLLLAAPAAAAEPTASGSCGENVSWEYYDETKTLRIFGSGAMENYFIFTPWRNDWKDILTVEIENGVTGIGNYAFFGCTSLTSVTLPESVTRIGDYSFESCTSLTSVTIPDSVTSIGECAFYDCSALTSVTIPDSVTSIGSGAFLNCTSLTSVTIPDGVTSIDVSAFYGCTALLSVTIPDSVTNIGYQAFHGCTALETVYYGGTKAEWQALSVGTNNAPLASAAIVFPDEPPLVPPTASGSCGENVSWEYYDGTKTLRIFGSGAMTSFSPFSPWWNYRNDILTVEIETGVTSIGNYAFRSCAALTSATVPDGVTSIGNQAFYGCTALASVTIPESVTSIGAYAFQSCSSLASVTIGNGVTSIGSQVFYNCTALASVTIGNGVTSIGYEAFYGCTSLSSVTIPDSVTSIGISAFRYCTSLTSVTIGNGVTSIGDQAFYGCTSLTSVTVGNGVKSIGNYAFENWRLETVYYTGTEAEWQAISIGTDNDPLSSAEIFFEYEQGFPVADGSCGENVSWEYYDETKTLRILGSGAMENYSYSSAPWWKYRNRIRTVQIETGVTSIGNYAFRSCAALTSVSVPDGVTNIGDSAFYGCAALPSVTIPDGVTGIGNEAFRGCTSLASVAFGNGVAGIGNYAFYGCTSLTSVTIPDSVTNIGHDAFRSCTALASVAVGNGVAGIGASAFYDCTALTSVTIGNGATSIGSSAFYGCTALTSVTIPDGVTNIGDSAFYGCALLEYHRYDGADYLGNSANPYVVLIKAGDQTKSIHDHTKLIYDRAFYGCTSLTSVTIPDSVTWIGNYAFAGCTSLASATIPDGVTSIGAYAFQNCSSLTSATIPDGVTSIGDQAFYHCTSLTSVTIPDSVTSIGDYAFAGCTSLTSVTVGNGVTSIGDQAFYHCTSLTSVTIPDSVTSIGDYAFYDCNALRIILYTGTEAEWQAVSIGEGNTPLTSAEIFFEYKKGFPAAGGSCGENVSWEYYGETMTLRIFGSGEMASYYNASSPWGKYPDGIRTVIIETGVTSIGDYAFRSCAALTSVTIPDSVTSIYVSAFEGCSSLTSLTIPNSVTRIWASAFEKCSSLASLTIPDSVTWIGRTAFASCTSLTSVTVGKGVTSVYDESWANVFSACHALAEFIVSPENPSYSSAGGVMFNKDKTSLLRYPAGKTGKHYTVPDGVTRIGDFAFENCTSLTSLTIPDSVTSFGHYVFYGCSALQIFFYAGTEAEWQVLVKGAYYPPLNSAEIRYGAVQQVFLDTANLSLLDAIGVNFYTVLTDAVTADDGAYALFTGPNGEKTILVSEAKDNGDGRLVFSYPVLAKQTLDEITICFFDGNGARIDLFMNDAALTGIGTEGYSYSVGEYLTAIGESEEGAEMKNLAAALTDYGAAADRLFGYSGGSAPAVQADLSGITEETTAAYKSVETGSEPSGFSLIGASLLVQSETTLRVYFSCAGEPAFSVTVDGESVTPVEKDGVYYVTVSGIAAKELGTVHQICFGDYQINCSALTYAYAVLKYYPETNTAEEVVNLRTLVKTLVRYYETAVAYFESK